MVEKQEPEWRIHAVAGSLLLLDVLTIGLAPAGPWDSQSFTLGVMGMTGLCLCYVAWYRATRSNRALADVDWLAHQPLRTLCDAQPRSFGRLAVAWFPEL